MSCNVANRVTLVDLVEIDMFDFDIILGMERLHDYFASTVVEQG